MSSPTSRNGNLTVANSGPAPSARLADCLLEERPTEAQHIVQINLDNSGSVFGSDAIKALRAAIPEFIRTLNSDWAISASALCAFAVFGGEREWCYCGPFAPPKELEAPAIEAYGGTPLCNRLIESIRVISAQRKLVRNVLKASQRRAWLLEITDGCATDSNLNREAMRAVQETAIENGIEVHLIGMGEAADMDFLNQLAQPGRPAEPLEELDYRKLFGWLSNSLRSVSRSMPGEIVEIPSLSGNLIRTE